MLDYINLILALKYMKPRFGLKPKEYTREDIEMKEIIKQ